jgi:hypothetical protein
MGMFYPEHPARTPQTTTLSSEMTRDEWIAAFAREAGVARPTVDQVSELLDLAGTAAHASERTAAPLACWIAGRSQLTLDELRVAAERVGPPAGETGETGEQRGGRAPRE